MASLQNLSFFFVSLGLWKVWNHFNMVEIKIFLRFIAKLNPSSATAITTFYTERKFEKSLSRDFLVLCTQCVYKSVCVE